MANCKKENVGRDLDTTLIGLLQRYACSEHHDKKTTWGQGDRPIYFQEIVRPQKTVRHILDKEVWKVKLVTVAHAASSMMMNAAFGEHILPRTGDLRWSSARLVIIG